LTRAYLIDLYDTLVSSDWERWRRTLSEMAGISIDLLDRAFHETRAARNTGEYPDLEASTRAVIRAAGLPEDDGIVRRWVEMDEEFMRTAVHLYGDSLPTVRGLRERGASAVLVSNCGPDTRLLVDRLDLESEFDALILSFEVGSRKPDPAIYEAGLAAVEARPDEAVFVDDQAAYCDGARAIGIDTRLILRPTASPPEGFAAASNGHVVISSLSELLLGPIDG
jgi:putative hydrolase of the HAD superfamily